MKCTFLIAPPLRGRREVERVFGCTYGLYPIPNIFFLYVASIFQRENYDVKYIDAPALKWSRNKFLDFIKRDDSQVYLFYTVNLSKETDLALLDIIKSSHPNSWIIFMGPAPTFEPNDYLRYKLTVVIRGEMEESAGELASFLSSGSPGLESIKGISYNHNGAIKINAAREPIKNIDALPFPARSLIKKESYYNPKLNILPFTVLLTSRGCYYKCRYCVPNSQSFARELAYRENCDDYRKPIVALRTFENVYDELLILKMEGYKGISIIDDQFVSSGEREIKIVEAIGRFGFSWGCLSRADRITKDIAMAFAKNKCRYVDIGVESFSQEILDDVNKGTTVEKLYEGIRLLKQYSVPIKLNILFGSSPRETLETFRFTMKTVKDLKVDSVMVSICNPFPGTEFWDIAQRSGWMLYPRYRPVDVLRESTIAYPHLNGKKMSNEVFRANISFFLRPAFLLTNVSRITSPFYFLKDLKAFLRKLGG